MNNQHAHTLCRHQGAAVVSLLLHAAFFFGLQALHGGKARPLAPLAKVLDVSLVGGAAASGRPGTLPRPSTATPGRTSARSPADSQPATAQAEPRLVALTTPGSPAASGASPSPAAAAGPGGSTNNGPAAADGGGTGTGTGTGAGAGSASLGEGGALQLATPLYRLNPPPVYPQVARQRRFEGVVLLRVLVLADGMVGELRLEKSSGHVVLDQAALKAVRGWAFAPGRRGGMPAAMEVLVPVRFALE